VENLYKFFLKSLVGNQWRELLKNMSAPTTTAKITANNNVTRMVIILRRCCHGCWRRKSFRPKKLIGMDNLYFTAQGKRLADSSSSELLTNPLRFLLVE